ncbi:MAG TPA: carboxypeptidase-like regulatory domain-containing protein [Candidatus Baltobacteraceae bacterium]|nr:carboxypeptidase-like regulatory domain-containing protein [Candidatus Baltobacteraceae bacterium]
MKVARFVLAFTIVTGLAACGPGVPPTGSYGTLTGYVKDAATGVPIAGATVSVSVVSSNVTGADGKYTVYPIPPGPYTAISATAPNYQAYNNGAGGTLAPGQTLNQDILMTHT